MQLTIESQQKNSLLDRTDLSGKIIFEGATPSNNEIVSEVAKKINSNENLIVMKNIYTLFSRQEASFNATVYDSTEARSKNEMVTKHLKKKQEAAAKKAEEEKPEEKKRPGGFGLLAILAITAGVVTYYIKGIRPRKKKKHSKENTKEQMEFLVLKGLFIT